MFTPVKQCTVNSKKYVLEKAESYRGNTTADKSYRVVGDNYLDPNVKGSAQYVVVINARPLFLTKQELSEFSSYEAQKIQWTKL